jgi:hypothetical protein
VSPARLSSPDTRRRVNLLSISVICALLGVASKRWTGPFSDLARGQVEDFTGTLFLILVPRAAFLHAPFARVALPPLVIVTAIELSQLFQGELLTRARATWLGLHVLGTTFEWADLLAYALAGASAGALDRHLRARASR